MPKEVTDELRGLTRFRKVSQGLTRFRQDSLRFPRIRYDSLGQVVYPSVTGAAVFSNLILKLRFPILAHPSESWDIYMYVCIHI